MEYKYELHCHTGAVSRCGRVEPEKIVEMYVEAGYNGIVVTDHYSPMTFPIHRLACPQKAADFYLSGYRRMQAAAPEGFYCAAGYGAAPLLDRQRLPDLRRDGGVYQECRQFDECVGSRGSKPCASKTAFSFIRRTLSVWVFAVRTRRILTG